MGSTAWTVVEDAGGVDCWEDVSLFRELICAKASGDASQNANKDRRMVWRIETSLCMRSRIILTLPESSMESFGSAVVGGLLTAHYLYGLCQFQDRTSNSGCAVTDRAYNQVLALL